MCVYVRIRSRTLIIAFKILQCQMSIIILTMLPSTYFAKATRFFLSNSSSSYFSISTMIVMLIRTVSQNSGWIIDLVKKII